MTTLELMAQCWLAGLEFEDDGDKLIVRPAHLITDEFRFQIARLKPVILRILKAEYAEGVPCKICNWHGRTYDGFCEHCIDLQVEAESKGQELILCRV